MIVRRCTSPTTINGIDIPVDLEIAIDVLSLHYDQELWGPTDPNIFYPTRCLSCRNKRFFLMEKVIKTCFILIDFRQKLNEIL